MEMMAHNCSIDRTPTLCGEHKVAVRRRRSKHPPLVGLPLPMLSQNVRYGRWQGQSPPAPRGLGLDDSTHGRCRKGQRVQRFAHDKRRISLAPLIVGMSGQTLGGLSNRLYGLIDSKAPARKGWRRLASPLAVSTRTSDGTLKVPLTPPNTTRAAFGAIWASMTVKSRK